MTIKYEPCKYHVNTKGVACCVQFIDKQEIDGTPITVFSHKGLLYIRVLDQYGLEETVILSHKEVAHIIPWLQAFVDDLGEEWK